jgi:hypothetical protein
LLVQAALLGGQHLDLLLHLHHAGALLVGAGLGLAQASSRSGSCMACSSTWAASSSACSSASTSCTGQVFQLGVGLLLARLPLGDLLGQLHQADLGTGFVQLALGLVDLVARGVVRLADGFQFGLDMRAGRPCAIPGRSRPAGLPGALGCCSASASARFRNHCWCCLSVASACSVL